MKLNAATKQAMKDMGIPEYAMDEYLKSGSHMSDEMKDKCKLAMKLGESQQMSDEEYEKHCPED